MLGSILPTIVQVISTAIIALLVWTVRHAQKEVRAFMDEHEFLLKTAKDNSAAIIRLNKRLDRGLHRHG